MYTIQLDKGCRVKPPLFSILHWHETELKCSWKDLKSQPKLLNISDLKNQYEVSCKMQVGLEDASLLQ